MAEQDRLFKLFLRIIGTAALFALVAVVMPIFWMNAIHEGLGMGPLPDEPIVGYLARSTSAFYAFIGGLLWLASFDLRRYRPVLCYIGAAIIIFGAVLFVVDLLGGMPLFCTFIISNLFIIMGIIIFTHSYRRAAEPD